MSKWQKPWRLFGGKCHHTSTGRVSSTGVVIVVWLKLGLKVIVGYLRTCGAQGVANKLLQSQQNVNMFFAATKIELTYLRLVYIQIQTHFSMFSAQQTSPSYEKKSFHFGPLPMFLFSASRRAQRLLLRDSWITTKPHGQTTGRSTRGDEHFPTKKRGLGFLAPEIFWALKYLQHTQLRMQVYQWFPFMRMNLDYVYPLRFTRV